MNEPTRMNRHDLIEYRACGTYDKMMDERPDGDYYAVSDIQAWAAEVMGLADKIDLQPWIDCACETCQENGEWLMKLKAKLGEVS